MDAKLEVRLHDLARQALGVWGMPDARLRLISYRENAVFEVSRANGTRAALRLHRPGYRSTAALQGELDWLVALAADSVPAPLPIATPTGAFLVALKDRDTTRQASMLAWVEGLPLGHAQQPLTWGGPDRERIFHALGRGMAQLHRSSDRWQPHAGFQRHAWDAEGLIGQMPLWGKFWQGLHLDPAEANQFSALRDELAEGLAQAKRLDFGLIHADLVRENVLVLQDEVRFIDFDDAGYGWRLFDLATALLPNLEEPDSVRIAGSIVAGYRSLRHLSEADLALLPMFLVLRALTYVGWFASRPEVDPSGERGRRHVARSLRLAAKWRSRWSPFENVR